MAEIKIEQKTDLAVVLVACHRCIACIYFLVFRDGENRGSN
jgi:hypothetical protein